MRDIEQICREPRIFTDTQLEDRMIIDLPDYSQLVALSTTIIEKAKRYIFAIGINSTLHCNPPLDHARQENISEALKVIYTSQQ